jgi:phosphoadenosine phosphosulfate reductase
MLTQDEVQSLNERFAAAPAADVLRWAWERFGERAAIGTSFQGAGLVMLHLAKEHGLNFPVFTLDTGLLFDETLELQTRLETLLGRSIEVLKPDLSVEQQAAAHGPELWKRDPDLCCTMRKVLPLRGKLAGLDCWITGLRRDQGETRSAVKLIELYDFDESSGGQIVKVNPMVQWSRESVWEYIRAHRIPYNPLQDQGFRSIGCRPCTQKTGDGEGERAGRWTGFNKTECGIHTFLTKKT